jgi:dipeptidyl aminopeptidase/acylaminoacyl peptidase
VKTRRALVLAATPLLLAAACGGSGRLPEDPPAWIEGREAPAARPTGAPARAPAASAPGYRGLGVESVPPEVLARFAPPPLAADASSHVQALLDVRAPGPGVVADGGRRMFFGWSVTGVAQVFRLDGPRTFPVQMTGGEDTTYVEAVLPDGKTLVLSRDRAGEENPGLYLQSADGGPLRRVQHEKGVQTFLDHVSDDGKSFLFRANDVAKDSFVIYRWDLAKGSRSVVLDAPGLWRVADEAGGKLLLHKAIGSQQAEYWELDAATKELTPLFGQGQREDYVARYGAGGEVVVQTNAPGEFRRIYAWKAGKLEPITPDVKHDVEDFSIDRRKTRIVYVTNEDGYLRLHAIDARTRRPIALPPLPKHDHARLGATSFDGRFTTLLVDPGDAPPQGWVLDWAKNQLVAWHAPSAPEMAPGSFARAELTSYPARDGTKIPVFVRRPTSCPTTPCPVVVHFHGGPESQTMAGFSTRAQMFVDAGFVFVEPNVRGSDGYGKTWLHADDGAKRLAIITDIEDAAIWAKKEFAAGGEAPRLGVFGGSYGGYSVLVAMTRFAGAYDAGVSVVGISNLLSFLENTAPYRRALRISEYGDPAKDAEALRALSPFFHADRVKDPLLLIQGATDPRVPVGEALQFREKLAAQGVDVPLIIFPDEGHGARKRPNQVLTYGHTLAFFREHLLGAR